eukprot:2197184-Karenia_brevis.AAC.1
MKLLVKCIQEERPDNKTVVEEVPEGSKGSNGIVEKGGSRDGGKDQVNIIEFGREIRKGN